MADRRRMPPRKTAGAALLHAPALAEGRRGDARHMRTLAQGLCLARLACRSRTGPHPPPRRIAERVMGARAATRTARDAPQGGRGASIVYIYVSKCMYELRVAVLIADRAPFGAQAPPPRGAMGRWARVAILAAVAALWVMIALAPARALAVRPPGAGASEGVISAQRYLAQSVILTGRRSAFQGCKKSKYQVQMLTGEDGRPARTHTQTVPHAFRTQAGATCSGLVATATRKARSTGAPWPGVSSVPSSRSLSAGVAL